MNAFAPHAGELYAKNYNDGIKVLVITPIRENNVGGWFCLGQLICRNGTWGKQMFVSVSPDDCLVSKGNRLPKCAALALRRHRAIQRKARAAYVNDDSCYRSEFGSLIYFARGI